MAPSLDSLALELLTGNAESKSPAKWAGPNAVRQYVLLQMSLPAQKTSSPVENPGA